MTKQSPVRLGLLPHIDTTLTAACLSLFLLLLDVKSTYLYDLVSFVAVDVDACCRLWYEYRLNTRSLYEYVPYVHELADLYVIK